MMTRKNAQALCLTQELGTKKTYTKASIDCDTLFWVFGVEEGFIDCSCNSIEKLEEAVDKAYPTKEDIIERIHVQDMIDNYIDNEF